MATKQWSADFVSDPRRAFRSHVELSTEEVAGLARIERDADGELYLVVEGNEDVRLPYRWLVSPADRVETLPAGDVRRP